MGDALASIDEGVSVDGETKRNASLTLAGKARGTTRHATDRDELLAWLDMLGLPPCERPMRTAEKWKKAKEASGCER